MGNALARLVHPRPSSRPDMTRLSPSPVPPPPEEPQLQIQVPEPSYDHLLPQSKPDEEPQPDIRSKPPSVVDLTRDHDSKSNSSSSIKSSLGPPIGDYKDRSPSPESPTPSEDHDPMQIDDPASPIHSANSDPGNQRTPLPPRHLFMTTSQYFCLAIALKMQHELEEARETDEEARETAKDGGTADEDGAGSDVEDLL